MSSLKHYPLITNVLKMDDAILVKALVSVMVSIVNFIIEEP